MNLRLPTVGPDSAKDTIERDRAVLRRLSVHCFAHDRASTSEDLEVGHGSSTGRSMASGGGKGSKSGGRRLVEEGAHRAGLPEKRLHCDDWNRE